MGEDETERYTSHEKLFLCGRHHSERKTLRDKSCRMTAASHDVYEKHITIIIIIFVIFIDLFRPVLIRTTWFGLYSLFTCSQLLPITTAAPSKVPPQVIRTSFILFLALYCLHGSSIYSPHAFLFFFAVTSMDIQSSGCVSLINKALP